MTTETAPRIRVVLGPIASDLMQAQAGDEEPHRDHLDDGIHQLRLERNALARELDELKAGSENEAPQKEDGPSEATLKVLIEIHLQLLELRKLSLAGFTWVSGKQDEALLQMEAQTTREQRKILERLGVDLTAFDGENRHHDRELQQHVPLIKDRSLGDDEKER